MPEYVMILLRALLAFVVLLALTRLMGKQQMSQLTFFDYVVGITIGSIAATLSVQQEVKLLNGVIGLVVWGLFPILFSLISLKSYRFHRLVSGRPTVLIEDGKVLEKNIRKEKMTTEELMLSLREKNAFNLADVEFAVLETNGKLSVMKKSNAQPLTPKAFGIQVQKESDPRFVVIDANVMEQTLAKLGYSKNWLLQQLKERGLLLEDVFLAQIDSKGNLYVDLYQDNTEIKQMPIKRIPSLTSALEQAQLELERFALEIQNPDIKQTFMQQAQQLKQSIQSLQPFLKK